ncbi:MAG: hypothetical protein A2Y23_14910 [Clostridiales bacterium GWB2_37_7]|nr:MAG: hypothetical protein A2Y23_14910 [Clostridiales bacterium GWB2_37_7]
MYKKYLNKLIGKKVVEINKMYPILVFDEEASLMIECSWRVRNNNIIIIDCSEYNDEKTHAEAHDKLFNLLLGKVIKRIELVPPVTDLAITFEKGLILDIFSNSNIYESWTLTDGKSFDLISATAGECCVFTW